MRIEPRLARLERQHGKPDETVDFLGETMTRAEFEALLRKAEGSTSQARVDTTNRKP